MKVFALILFTFFFSFSTLKADWIKLFSTNEADLYIDAKSIERKKNRIFYNQLVDYRKKRADEILSFKTISELDCDSLKVRDLNYGLFKKKMGEGNNIYKGNPSKQWKKYKKGTSAALLNKLLCDRVYRK